MKKNKLNRDNYIIYSKNKSPRGKSKTLKIYKQLNLNDCWRTAIANILQVEPIRVPHFVKKHKMNYIKKTREWLNVKHDKSITFIPIMEFLETGKYKYNNNVFPQGKSIMMVFTDNKCIDTHVFLCFDGELIENFDGQYTNILGYFIIHDL